MRFLLSIRGIFIDIFYVLGCKGNFRFKKKKKGSILVVFIDYSVVKLEISN